MKQQSTGVNIPLSEYRCLIQSAARLEQIESAFKAGYKVEDIMQIFGIVKDKPLLKKLADAFSSIFGNTETEAEE